MKSFWKGVRSGHVGTLISSLLCFDVSFMVWVPELALAPIVPVSQPTLRSRALSGRAVGRLYLEAAFSRSCGAGRGILADARREKYCHDMVEMGS